MNMGAENRMLQWIQQVLARRNLGWKTDISAFGAAALDISCDQSFEVCRKELQTEKIITFL